MNILPNLVRYPGVPTMSFARLLCAALLACSPPAFAIGTAFTYQGTLEDGGSPANGSYDLQFRALDGTGTQVGPLLSLADVAITNGVFSVQLDFGLTVFTGDDRFLQIGVRPGASVGSFTILAPDTPINPAPYAQVADLALGVPSGTIGTVQLTPDAVTSSRIATGAVLSSDIGDGSVAEADLANGSVTTLKLPSGGVPPSRLAGDFGTYGITVSVGPNSCNDYLVPIGGDVNQNDLPLLALSAGAVLPTRLTLTALRATADNEIEIRACNYGNTTVSAVGINIRLITFR